MNQANNNGSYESVDIASKIETLENKFDDLRTQIINELSTKSDVTVRRLLDSLTSLPLLLKKEYESSMAKHIPSMSTETKIKELFIHLNPLTSFIDYQVIENFVRNFGNDSLRRDMQSYCSEMRDFTKETTIMQLINYFPRKSQIPPNTSLIEAKIGEDASKCTLEQLNTIRRRYCSEVKLSEVVFHLVAVVESNSPNTVIVRLLVPSVLVTDIMRSTRNVDRSFYQEYKIASFTLDGMWLFLSEAEIDAMWSQKRVSDTQVNKEIFNTMYKQIVCELGMQGVSEHDLSLYLMDQEPRLQHNNISVDISKAFLERNFPLSFVDYKILTIIIEEFGSDCLKSMMKSYCNYMSIYAKMSTVQQLIELSPVQCKPSRGFVTAECRMITDPSDYKLEQLLSFQTKFCAIANLNGLYFVFSEVNKRRNGLFSVNWLIPSSIALDLLKCGNQIEEAEFFKEFYISSINIGSGFLYHYQLTPFGTELKEKYQSLPSPIESIPSPTKKIFRLPMIQRERKQRGHIDDTSVQMTISGRVDDILHAKSPEELEHFFRKTLRGGEIILIEGAPGSGKSTLTVHICQRWAKGELFQQFTVVILVQLRDPEVQRAQTIAHLLPIKNVTVAQELATELRATNGRGVLWVLDGWDQLPPHLQQNSIFCKLLPPKPSEQKLAELEQDPVYKEYVHSGYNKVELWSQYLHNNPVFENQYYKDRILNESSVIVTSHPISSGDLHPVVSSRIVVLGFTPEEQRQYFTECLQGDTKTLEALLEKIQENPVVQSICYLPLNAAFIVHTFKYISQLLPNTEYKMYSMIILNCIQHHFEREGRGHNLPRKLASLDDLFRNKTVKKPFKYLCELAYHGVMENKVTFSSSDLPQGFTTFSLLQAVGSFLQSGKSVFYNFFHLSIQEVLAAYYIATWLSGNKQMSQFQQLFNQPRFAAVFQFYAAITKLKGKRMNLVIARIIETKSKPLIVSLLRYLHEAQDPSLCHYVLEMLGHKVDPSLHRYLDEDEMSGYKLDVHETSLSPLDCLSVSFFLSVANKEIKVDLRRCHVRDIGAKYLVNYLCCDHAADHVTINLDDNAIHDEGASYLAKMLYFVEHLHLNLSKNSIGDTGASLISEAIRKTVSLKTLKFICCSTFSKAIENILLALSQNNSLKKFDITWNDLGDEAVTQPSHDFIHLVAEVDKNLKKYALTNLGTVVRQICAKANLSNLVFHLTAQEKLNSFIVSWRIPLVPISCLMEIGREIEAGYLDMISIISLFVGNLWLYHPNLSRFCSILKKQHQQSQGSPSPIEWIPSPTRKIFRLAMIQRERVQRGHIEDRFVQMTVSGRVDDILHAKSPVELENIFRDTLHGGEIILIEGAPGSGKSTLTVHICQRWGKGELFQQFTVVILVQLRDPAVQRAQIIADLLPVENAQELATELKATNGRGVLWVLDGWDELPPHLQRDSIFRKLLPPNLSSIDHVTQNIERLLCECSVIVTSRPISSGDLHPVVSSRIEVLGFTPEEQRQYFTECFKGDTKALEALLQKIQENPVVQSICYLPLNAAFIVHTFKYMGQSLPNTEYEIYLSVILSCIQRHFEREGREHDLHRKLASLGDLSRSEAVREPFQCLCELAYHGVMENKVTFSSSDLPQGSNTLSLLQAIESYLQSGKSMFYNFLHLSIQEVLSAYYIATQLSDSEQVSQFQQLFDQPRFAAVFQFYASITKLKSPAIRQVIARIVEAKSKPLLLSLLHCLYEAQDHSLCRYVAERLDVTFYTTNMQRLDISNNSLSPLDCLSVSFFLSSAGVGITVDFFKCFIGDLGAKSLIKYLDDGVDHVGKVAINLLVGYNDIHEEGTSHIARTVNFIEHLDLSHNPIGDTGASLLSKAVRETATLKTLILYDCGITSRGAEDLSRALDQNNIFLKKLNIGLNNLGDKGISHVAEALEQNKQLKELWIGECGMTDKGAASLANALSVNNSLKMLHIGELRGALTKDGLSTITQSLVSNSGFVRLLINVEGFDSTAAGRFNQKINEARKRNKLPPIEIEGE